MNKCTRCVMSLGGSLIYPSGGIDIEFLKTFHTFARARIEKEPETRLFIVVGGGRVARMYQEVAKLLTDDSVTHDQLDYLGIQATRQNAQLLHVLFSDIAHPDIVIDYDDLPEVTKPVLIGAGWKPGHSTDYDAVRFAEHYKADTILNLSNVDQVYTKDPKKYDDAEPVAEMSWDDLLTLTGTTWDPGANLPFDPIAAKRAKDANKQVVIMNGGDFENLENYTKGDTFIGTIIK